MLYCCLYLLALVDSLAVVLLDSLVFFFCWVAEGFLSSCSSGSGAGGSLWSASELPLLVLGLSSSDLCLSLDIVGNFFGGTRRNEAELIKRAGLSLAIPQVPVELVTTLFHREIIRNILLCLVPKGCSLTATKQYLHFWKYRYFQFLNPLAFFSYFKQYANCRLCSKAWDRFSRVLRQWALITYDTW